MLNVEIHFMCDFRPLSSFGRLSTEESRDGHNDENKRETAKHCGKDGEVRGDGNAEILE